VTRSPSRARHAEPDELLRLLVTVTLNPNQLRSHIVPIAELDAVGSITYVADSPAPSIPKLRTVVPRSWLVRVVGRAAAKLLTGVVIALREKPHWVLGYKLVPHGVNALLIGRVTRARVLLHIIGGPAEYEGGGWRSDNAILDRLPRPIPWLERALVRLIAQADVVAVMGEGARRDLAARGVRQDQLVVLPASVDDEVFDARSRSSPRWDICTVSQLIPRKRIQDLLEAAAMLLAHRPLRLVIAGSGPLEAELRARAHELGIDRQVDFVGFRTDIRRIYAQSRVFVLPSRREGLSIALTEAMAMGLAVISTDIGEVRDLVQHGVNGMLYRVADVAGLARLIEELLGDPSFYESLSAAAVAAAKRVSSRDRIREINREILEKAYLGPGRDGS
jgi:glycosyltransferase involved in cell wall biosynthesis